MGGADDRRATVEIQVNQPLTLDGNLWAVVIPRSALENPAVRDAVFRAGKVHAIDYPTYDGSSPSQYYGVIKEELDRFLTDEGRL